MRIRDVYGGVVAGGLAVLAMAGTAVAGLLLLGAGRVGRLDQLAAAVVGMSVGAPAVVGASPSGGLPVALNGRIDVMPLGVSVVGAVVLGVLLLSHPRTSLLVRGTTAALVFTAGVGAIARVARGSLALPAGGASAAVEARGCPGGLGVLPGGGSSGGGTPGGGSSGGGLLGGVLSGGGLLGGGSPRGGSPAGGLPGLGSIDAAFSVPVGSAVAGAAGLALAVIAVCWLCGRFPAAGTGLRALRWPALAIAVTGLAAAWALGGPMAVGGLLLALPLVATGALLLGLGVPWTVRADGVLSCVLDGTPAAPTGGLLALVAAVVLLICGLVVAVARSAASREMGISSAGDRQDPAPATATATAAADDDATAADDAATAATAADAATAATAADADDAAIGGPAGISDGSVVGGTADDRVPAAAPGPNSVPSFLGCKRDALRQAVVTAGWAAVVAGLALGGLAVLSAGSAELGARAFVFALPLLDVRVAADPWLALAVGAGAGAVAGFAGSVLADLFARRRFVGWRA
ncbi:hypothetical protein [Actinoplanes solisilvae]|uniref:hypothetical protein n=1 Tax=Actinoplanes solisilvae TaxID=2486853 RepID=UPI000FD7062C|nr:hypothetical protein [Actinoplanes solisilvae]